MSRTISTRDSSFESSEIRDDHVIIESSDHQRDFDICKADHYTFVPDHIGNDDAIDPVLDDQTESISQLSAISQSYESSPTSSPSPKRTMLSPSPKGRCRVHYGHHSRDRRDDRIESVQLELRSMRRKGAHVQPPPSPPPCSRACSPTFTPRWHLSSSGMSSDPSLSMISTPTVTTSTDTLSIPSDPSSLSILSAAPKPKRSKSKKANATKHGDGSRAMIRRDSFSDDVGSKIERLERAIHRQRGSAKGKKRKGRNSGKGAGGSALSAESSRSRPSPHDSVVLPMLRLQRTFSDEHTSGTPTDGPPPYFVKRGPGAASQRNTFLSTMGSVEDSSISRTPSPRQDQFPKRDCSLGQGHRRTKTNNPFSNSRGKSKKKKISKIPLIRESYIHSAPSPNRGRRPPTPRGRGSKESARNIQRVSGYHIVDSDGGSISYVDFNEDAL